MHGFVRVHEKALAGWKGLSKDPNLPEAIDVILAKDYALLAWAIRLTPERTALRREDQRGRE
jgi:hypothetical protein